MIGIFSFFAGAGFLDLGFETTGNYQTLFVNEFKPSFNRIYRYARENMKILPPQYGYHIGDINELLTDDMKALRLKEYVHDAQQNPDIDYIAFIGGPPCPDFSVAGRNRGREGDNGKLSQDYVNVICRYQPDLFVFENVKGLYRTAKHRVFFEELKKQLADAGYYMTEQLINSIEFGAPQDRDRIILIGFHKNQLKSLHIETNDHQIKGFNWDANKLFSRDVFNLPWPGKEPYHENTQTPIPKGIIEQLTVQFWWDKNDVTNHPNEDMFFQPRAGLYRFQTKDEGDVEKKCYKRLHRWRYSPTAAYGNNEVHIHPYLPRRISVAEALAIQSLPAQFIIPHDITLSDAFKTIGNGVPYLAAKGVANNIYDFINRKHK